MAEPMTTPTAESLEAASDWLHTNMPNSALGRRAFLIEPLAALLDSREAPLRAEIENLKIEYARVTGVSEDESWTLDVPGDDMACVAEYRIRWLRVKMRAEAAEARVKELEASMVSHFQREHLEGDGPEIDLWRERVKALEVERKDLLDSVEQARAKLYK